MPIETRSTPSPVTASSGQVGGYAALYGVEATIHDARGNPFREVIRPGAFARCLNPTADVRAMYDHGNRLLGRTKAGTLTLKTDERGLAYHLTLPTSAADLLESIQRGDLDGCSFGFQVREDQWSARDGMPVREIRDVDLVEISLTPFPAYQGTSIDLRSVRIPSPIIWQNELLRLRMHMMEKIHR